MPKVGDRFNPYRMFTGIFIPEGMCQYKGLSPGAKLAYGRFSRYAGNSGEVFPSMSTMGEELGLSQNQARSYIHELVEEKFVGVEFEKGKSNSYYFIWHPAFEGDVGISRFPVPLQDAGGVNENGTPPACWSTPLQHAGGVPLQHAGAERESLKESQHRQDRDADFDEGVLTVIPEIESSERVIVSKKKSKEEEKLLKREAKHQAQRQELEARNARFAIRTPGIQEETGAGLIGLGWKVPTRPPVTEIEPRPLGWQLLRDAGWTDIESLTEETYAKICKIKHRDFYGNEPGPEEIDPDSPYGIWTRLTNFDSAWFMYWRKERKREARKVFFDVARAVEVQSWILGAIEIQTPEILSRDPKYQPTFINWLRDERWTDTPIESVKALNESEYIPEPKEDRFAKKLEQVFG